MPERTRVLVAEDSPTVRAHLVEALASDRGVDVVAVAEDGRSAVDLCAELRPDVITMDMAMPGMNGLDATRLVMRRFPTPILIVSASTNRGDAFHTYDALAAGAVDVLEKPPAGEPAGAWEQKFVATVKLVSRIRVVSRRQTGHGVQPEPEPAGAAARPAGREGTGPYAVLALGASTGGPAALVTVLGQLPSGFDLPVLFVLHIGAAFSATFADWLSGQIHRKVTIARHRQPITAGQVVMAPPDRHLAVASGRLLLDDGPERHSCRPSVDVLFESLADDYGPAGVACLLTGMGRDGAAGLAAVRRRGGLTIAQDEASCVVYGMPREAARSGAATHVLPLAQIAPALSGLVTGRAGDAPVSRPRSGAETS
jgi:two-component system chemotaxis response regulator CheB